MDASIVVTPDGWRTLEPKPSADELKAFYAGEYFQASHGTYRPDYTATERSHRALLAALLLQAIERARPRGETDGLLEIGCGEGWFLAAAREAGYAVTGIDFSADGLTRFHPDLVEHACFGDAFALMEQMITEGRQADVCVMEHVLEHVLDPEALLQRLPRLLRPGGVVAITVPNDYSRLQTAALDAGAIDRPFWLAPPQHLSYFNTESLPLLLARSGFEVKVAFASFPIDWFLMHPGSNYVVDPAQGKAAHQARLAIDLILAEAGMAPYLDLARALFSCGAGRSITVIAKVA